MTALERISTFPKIRIAHFHSSLGVYGAERWTSALLNAMTDSDFHSIVITVGTKPDSDLFCRTLIADGFSAHHFRIAGKLNPNIIIAMRGFLVRHGIKVLHTHGFKADILGYLATRNLPIKLVSTVHGWTPNEGYKVRIYEALSRYFLRRFDRVYPLSPALREQLLQCNFTPSKVKLILNGVDLSTLEYREYSRKNDEPINFLFAGRLCRPKGIFELLRAFSAARFSVPARLRIAGDGPDREELYELCRELDVTNKIEFLGQIPSVAPVLKVSNVLVLPSHSEGIPRVIMEAFACGVPVIGSSIPGIKQLVQHETTGFLVPPNDVSALCGSLERISISSELAAQMARNARETVINTYSSVRMAREFATEYRELCPC